MIKFLSSYKLRICLFLFLLFGCGLDSTPEPLAELPEGCTAPGTIISADLPQPTRGYTYSYRAYLPPCFYAERESRYPVLYLIPGRSSSPATWFETEFAEILDRMIMSNDIHPFIVVTTESIDNDPMAETIYNDLIPFIESHYPIVDNRQYRAVAGASLGGIAAYRLAFQYPNKFSSAGIFGAGAISGEESRINEWLLPITDKNKLRVFMDTGDEDILMLERAKVMKSMLDDMGIENQLHIGHGGHDYVYWVGNFEIYLRWLTKDW